MNRFIKYWLIPNMVVFGIFIAGHHYQNEALTILGVWLYWILSIIGTIALVVIFIARRTDGFQNLRFARIPRSIDITKEQFVLFQKQQAEDGIRLMKEDTLRFGSVGSVPQWVDVLFDLVVTGTMIYYGYNWLPVFYVIHILGGMSIREMNKYILRVSDIFIPKEIEITGELWTKKEEKEGESNER